MAKIRNGHHAEPAPEPTTPPEAAHEAAPTEPAQEPPPEPVTPEESPEALTARLKQVALNAISNEAAAAAAYADAKTASAEAEHALCEHLKAARGGSLKGVEIEIAGARYKPKLFEKTGKYRLDRVSHHETI